jgi:hypothetical protein
VDRAGNRAAGNHGGETDGAPVLLEQPDVGVAMPDPQADEAHRPRSNEAADLGAAGRAHRGVAPAVVLDQQGHGARAVRAQVWQTGDSEAVGEAFTSAVDAVASWLDHPHDPNFWRTKAGLLNPP